MWEMRKERRRTGKSKAFYIPSGQHEEDEMNARDESHNSHAAVKNTAGRLLKMLRCLRTAVLKDLIVP